METRRRPLPSVSNSIFREKSRQQRQQTQRESRPVSTWRTSPSEAGCSRTHWTCIEEPFRNAMYQLGVMIGRFPWPFLVVPLILAAALSAGILLIEHEEDTEKVYAVRDSPTIKHKERLKVLYPQDYTENFQPNALISQGRFVNVIAKAKKGDGDVFKRDALAEVLQLDRHIKSLPILLKDRPIKPFQLQNVTFRHLCAKWDNKCIDVNPALDELKYDAMNFRKGKLTYPFHLSKSDVDDINFVFIGGSMSVPMLDVRDSVQSATAILLTYHLRDDKNYEPGSIEWSDKVISDLESRKHNFSFIDISYFSSQSLDQEVQKSSEEVIPKFSIAIGLIVLFSVLSCMMGDWAKAKPLVALSGVISPGLAIGATFGLLFVAGQKYASTVGTVPFLIMAIGVDGMFVFVAAWRHTSPYLCTDERMGLTYMDAGVSVTITSLTDVLALAIGALSPFRGITYFCTFAAVGAAIDYVFQLTFFGACLAIFGKREENNRHSLLCVKLTPSSQAHEKNVCFRFWCTGGVERKHPSREDDKSHIFSRFFRKYYGPLLMKPAVQVLVLLLFFIYLGAAVYGCLGLKQGLRRQDLPVDGSYAIQYYDDSERYFSYYSLPVQIVIDEPLNYMQTADRNKSLELFYSFKDSPLYHERLASFWLEDFLDWSKGQDSQPHTESQLIKTLYEEFFPKKRFERFRTDVVIDNTTNRIFASRFHLTARNVNTTAKEEKVLVESRKLCQKSDLEAFPYNPYFVFYEQYLVILPTLLQNLGIAVGCMFVVALMFLPSPTSALWVMACIASIELGVLGFMSLWGVRLDMVAMICVVMCIGFSVDYSAHVAYAMVEARAPRAPNALSLIGYPVIQSAVSTIVGVAILATSVAQIGQTFFKIVFLVTTIGAFHGLCVLPVILELFDCCNPNSDQDEKDDKAVAPKVTDAVDDQFAEYETWHIENYWGNRARLRQSVAYFQEGAKWTSPENRRLTRRQKIRKTRKLELLQNGSQGVTSPSRSRGPLTSLMNWSRRDHPSERNNVPGGKRRFKVRIRKSQKKRMEANGHAASKPNLHASNGSTSHVTETPAPVVKFELPNTTARYIPNRDAKQARYNPSYDLEEVNEYSDDYDDTVAPIPKGYQKLNKAHQPRLNDYDNTVLNPPRSYAADGSYDDVTVPHPSLPPRAPLFSSNPNISASAGPPVAPKPTRHTPTSPTSPGGNKPPLGGVAVLPVGGLRVVRPPRPPKSNGFG